MSNHLFVENKFPVMAFPPAASPASTEDYVSMKTAARAIVIIAIDNATSVTGTTVTLKQASAVAGTGEKALAFTTVYVNADTAASDTLVKTAVTSSTFDTATTDNKNLLYVIHVEASSLDQVNGFDCLRVDVTGNANSVVSGLYIMEGLRYPGGLPSASFITD
jgi:hypothetical protein